MTVVVGNTLAELVTRSLQQAEQYNLNLMIKPEVVLWPDPERQWEAVIPMLQVQLEALLVLGPYQPKKKQGPAIWLKCMVAKVLFDANWADSVTPIIYMPGISKQDLKNTAQAGLDLQPLVEYQYTGTIWTQENGKEWTILAFLQNQQVGMGLKVSQDAQTKEALKKALPSLFQEEDLLYGKTVIDAEYIHSLQFQDIVPSILHWLCKGDVFLQTLSFEKREIFSDLCKTRYDFTPDYRMVKDVAEKLGTQRNNWKQVWLYYANAPGKFPQIQGLLRIAKPDDLGIGVFALPAESWPQVNEQAEEQLRQGLSSIGKLLPKDALNKLRTLQEQHGHRRQWIWAELGQTPLANALAYLYQMASVAMESFPAGILEELKVYYTEKGYLVDQAMRKAMATVKTKKDKDAIKVVISTVYKPWLETITNRFQGFVKYDASIFTKQVGTEESESFVLFIDAFRYELAKEFVDRLEKLQYNVSLHSGWSAIPSLTPTAKPNVSPVAGIVSVISEFSEFRPRLNSGKDLLTAVFREALSQCKFKYIASSDDIIPGQKHWQEIGQIDTKGHEEQADMVKRIDELFDNALEVIQSVFEKGIKRIKIVTDHGWLLLPGGLPKEELKKDLVETRWGRCALIKEGAKTDLLHLPWRWNPGIFIAYAPGISFFKKNEEYAHGGISIHECLVPTLIIENFQNNAIQAKIQEAKWVNLKCTITTNGAPDGYLLDIRTKFSNSSCSIVLSTSRTIKDNRCTLMVDDAAESQSATIVLMNADQIILDKYLTHVGG